VQLELPGTASRADAQLMVEGKIQGLGHEPKNVQVRTTEGEDSARLIELELLLELEPLLELGASHFCKACTFLRVVWALIRIDQRRIIRAAG